MKGIANTSEQMNLGGGAQFWVYLSPDNQTKDRVKGWSVTFSQGRWSDTIDASNPTKVIKTPNLSGIFDIEVTEMDYSTHPARTIAIPAKPPSTNKIGCNDNCAAMVGIVADEDRTLGGSNAKFWTTWDALCKR